MPHPKPPADSTVRRPARRTFTVADLAAGVRAGDRAVLGRAITLVESRHPDHQADAQALLLALTPHAGHAHRVGITGVPGVGKSTFIEALGCRLTAAGHRVAVLAVDPSSSRSGGSILGDKTRMQRLSVDRNAFIRPSPSSGTLGGVTRVTRETMVVVEAAGFDVVLVETVGAGQSETAVADMVDFFLVLMLPGAGDELQGIKKGILEIADMIAVNKADGDNAVRAKQAVLDYEAALHILVPASRNWSPPVLTVSALRDQGLDALWAKIEEHRLTLSGSGEFQSRRRRQQVGWTWAMVEDRVLRALHAHPDVAARGRSIEEAVTDGRLTPTLAAQELLTLFGIEAD